MSINEGVGRSSKVVKYDLSNMLDRMRGDGLNYTQMCEEINSTVLLGVDSITKDIISRYFRKETKKLKFETVQEENLADSLTSGVRQLIFTMNRLDMDKVDRQSIRYFVKSWERSMLSKISRFKNQTQQEDNNVRGVRLEIQEMILSFTRVLCADCKRRIVGQIKVYEAEEEVESQKKEKDRKEPKNYVQRILAKDRLSGDKRIESRI